MATNNFYNHENGILVINMHDSYDDYKEYLKMELDHEFITQEEYEDRIENMDCYYDWANCESIINLRLELEYIKEKLEEKGYDVYTESDYRFIVEKNYRTVAWCSVKSGYYDGVQLIVDTSPDNLDGYYNTQAELYEQYTPHNKRLLKLLEKLTIPIVQVGQFCNGEALYEYKNN